MSSQPYPPSTNQPAMNQPAVSTPPTGGGRKPILVLLGGLLLAAGVVAGIILLLQSSSSVEDHVKKMARAPAGCTTSLQFDSQGTFEVFIERTGKVGELSGGCPASGSSYDRRGTDLPSPSLQLVDRRDRAVDIDDADASTYDAGGFRGTRIGNVTIDNPGEYKLTVTPDDPDDANYAVSIGKNPTEQQGTLRTAGIASLAGGVVIGGLLLALGLRRRRATPTAPLAASPTAAPAWTPSAPAAPWSGHVPPTNAGPTPTWAPQQPTAPVAPAWPPASTGSSPSSDRPDRPDDPSTTPPDEPTQVRPPSSPFAPPRHPGSS